MTERTDANGERLSPLAQVLASNIQRLRTRRDLSRVELARRAGLGSGMVYTIETGRHSPRLRTVEALAAALSVEPIELLLDLSGDEDGAA